MKKAVEQSHLSIGIVIVAYGQADDIKDLLDQIETEKQPGDYIVVIDNHPDHASDAMARAHVAVDFTKAGDNVGFAKGCNIGVSYLPPEIDLILFLNPDIAMKPGALAEMRKIPPDWAASSGLILLPSGRVNAEGNVLHLSGLAWCDRLDEPVSTPLVPRSLHCLSGACLMIRHSIWDEMGGFEEDFFMYYEDIDLSVRLSLAGHKIGLQTNAVFVHDYSFVKGDYKWHYIERNRFLFMWRTWPIKVLLFLSPFLLLIEIGLWVTAALEGRAIMRLRSVVSAIRLLPRALRQRRHIQRHSKISSKEFYRLLSPTIDTPAVRGASASWLANRIYSMIYVIGLRLLP